MARALRHARAALAEAIEAYEKMQQAQDYAELQKYWGAFLRAADRTWNKIEAAAAKAPNFRKIKESHGRLTKQDELIRYVKVARDTDEHSIREVMKPSLSISIGGEGQTGHLKHMEIKEGGVVEYEGTPGLARIQFHTELLIVENRGVKAHPPRVHLGEAMRPSTHTVAVKTIAYYTALISRVEVECGL